MFESDKRASVRKSPKFAKGIEKYYEHSKISRAMLQSINSNFQNHTNFIHQKTKVTFWIVTFS